MIRHELAYKAACEGIVLLERRTLPITPQKIAIYGAGARYTIKGGSGSGEVNSDYSVSIVEGLINEGFEIASNNWLDRYSRLYEQAYQSHSRHFKLRYLKDTFAFNFHYPEDILIEEMDIVDADVCIYVISRQAGEGNDRSIQDYMLSEQERQNLNICAEHYKNIILVVNVGGFFDLSFVDEIAEIGDVIFMAQLGQEGGNAVAAVIDGKVNPSGRLAFSWPKNYAQVPYGDEFGKLNGDISKDLYREGIYVGYRYYDSYGVRPRYAFGYGLAYTEYKVRLETIAYNGSRVSCRVRVQNIGHTAGRNAVLLYAKCPQGRLTKEYKRLVTFAKTGVIMPGEAEVIYMDFDLRLLASYDAINCARIIEVGEYYLTDGRDSLATLKCIEEIVISENKALRKPPVAFMEYEPEMVKENIEKNDIVIEIKDYLDKATSCSEAGIKIKLVNPIGGGYPDWKQHNNISGAAGSALIQDSDGHNRVVWMADGPAGLRLARTAIKDLRGDTRMVEPGMEVLGFIPRLFRRFFYGSKLKGEIIRQNATAFPVEMAIAQTFDAGVAKAIGACVSEEMQTLGIRFWLAPGMNIQRNPLCGRNFEYFSEDPVVSGLMAAAVVKGVQSIEGNYATIKHFCCNNREAGRNIMSAMVYERALREIYLLGFEIAIRESNPAAVMTSYNKVNGVYATADAELIEGVLKGEWGYKGLVMTDWFATSRGHANNEATIAAGTDLIMPGGATYRKILRASKWEI